MSLLEPLPFISKSIPGFSRLGVCVSAHLAETHRGDLFHFVNTLEEITTPAYPLFETDPVGFSQARDRFQRNEERGGGCLSMSMVCRGDGASESRLNASLFPSRCPEARPARVGDPLAGAIHFVVLGFKRAIDTFFLADVEKYHQCIYRRDERNSIPRGSDDRQPEWLLTANFDSASPDRREAKTVCSSARPRPAPSSIECIAQMLHEPLHLRNLVSIHRFKGVLKVFEGFAVPVF